ncbi:PREDICTED: uncharacterized protein LOC106784685 [Polistes canadensis]|uniref:uncharacterized protein LOC106784685 n=1 Tax=Polistes canadensis TaxID=91411 RepID=UPI000718F1E4|nr:PREDICTED: uncharacterized protein LOC106784685 [Polistes canadensis]KAI4478658.1 hypothetical protein M0804_011686 [Polistes exclamans]
MRKYYQATLVVVAVVSLVSLLFYRHEYNRLRYVLEVFNYFGNPNQKAISTNCINNNVSFIEHNIKLDEPSSSWQRLNDDLYVYSAYNLGNNKVHAISFSKRSAVSNLQCIIYFEHETKPFVGNYKYIVINSTPYFENEGEKAEYNGYYLICAYKENKLPVGVSFLTEFDKDSTNVPIFSVATQPRYLNGNSITVCIIPPLLKPMHEIDMITFISFHELIGVNNFIAYDFGIVNTLNNRFKELSAIYIPQSNFTYTTVPWNFPFSRLDTNIMKDIIEADCLHRTYNKMMYISILSWQEYIALNYHRSLVDLLADYSASKLLADRYKLNILTFCTKELDNNPSANFTLIMYRKLQFDTDVTGHYPIFISKPHEVLSKNNVYTQKMAKDLILVHNYKICNDVKTIQKVNVFNTSIPRFSKDIRNSPIFTRLISH